MNIHNYKLMLCTGIHLLLVHVNQFSMYAAVMLHVHTTYMYDQWLYEPIVRMINFVLNILDRPGYWEARVFSIFFCYPAHGILILLLGKVFVYGI